MRNSWKASLLGSVALSLFGVTASAQDGGEINHISGIQVDETADQTVIHIVGDMHPTYSVYRLRNPLRLFVDVANSELSSER